LKLDELVTKLFVGVFLFEGGEFFFELSDLIVGLFGFLGLIFDKENKSDDDG